MDKNKSVVTGVMWLAFLGVSAVLIINASGWGVLGAFVLAIPLMAISAMMWENDDAPVTHSDLAQLDEKRKRDTLDAVLRDLSTDQLEILKRRLQDDVITDDVLEQRLVGDDGEFVKAAPRD